MKPKYEFPADNVISLECELGDVAVRGEPGRRVGQITPVKEGAPPVIESTEQGTIVRASGSISVQLPLGADVVLRGQVADLVLRDLGVVTMDGCNGDLVASGLVSLKAEGHLRGDVAVRKIRDGAQLQSVSGDLAVAQAAAISVQHVHGDASIVDTQSIQVDSVEGDIAITQALSADLGTIVGDASITARGDVDLRGPLSANGTYTIKAGGNVVARVMGDAHIIARARGDLRVGPGLASEQFEGGWCDIWMGEHDRAATLTIEANGDITLNSVEQWHTHPQTVIDAEVRRTMDEVSTELQNAAIAVRTEMGRALSAGIGARGASMRGILREVFDSLTPQPAAPPPLPVEPKKPTKPPTDEIRLILEMVESGTISVEEAEKLIAACS